LSQHAKASVTISNRLGLHARPVTDFVRLANRYECSIVVRRDELEVDGKSALSMIQLVATCGTALEIEAEGPDAEDAVQQLVALVESGFGDDE